MHSMDSIRICIVDDIKSVVDGLTAVPWQEYGITLAGTSGNGEDGLELIQRVKPDIVITDIRMPKMDGLTMVRSILELQHACQIILISGYTDFDYAKQAVQLGAFDFVVKPFTEEEILDAVCRAKEQIEQERSKLLSVREMETKLRESLPLLRKEYFALLVQYRTPTEQALKRWDFLDIDMARQGFCVMLIEIDGFLTRIEQLSVSEVELLRFSLQNIVEETLREHTACIVFRAQQNRFVAVVNTTEASMPVQLAEHCCKNIEQYTRFTISIGVGGKVQELSELPESYLQADRALSHRLFTEGNGAIAYDEIPRTDRQEPLAFEQKEELLLLLRSGNRDRVGVLLADITDSLQRMSPRPHPDYLLSHYEELAASAIRTFYELIPFQDIHPLVERFKQQRSGLTLSGLEQLLLGLCREGAELVRKHTLSDGQAIIYKSIDYMKQHLNREITVGECAAYVHLSASYYSSLFKKVTGMTVTQFVAAERIQKAKSLLIAGMPVQEVAAELGYEERRYFSEVFKKITGMTPSEFRASYHPEPSGS
jgi:two-component system, response regulator YesN